MPLHRLKPNGTVSNTGWTVTGASADAAVTAADHPATPSGSTNISTVNSAGDTIIFDLDTDAMTSDATLCVLRVYVTSTAGWALDATISGDGGSTWETVQSQSGGASGSWVGFPFRTNFSSLASVQVQLTGYGDDATQDTTVEAVELRVVEAGTATNTGVAPFISGLQLLIEADDQGGADGTALGVISDSSGAEAHGISTGAQRSTLHTNVVNGRSVLRFDGSANYFDLPDFMNAASATAGEIFLVVKGDASPVSDGAWLFGTDAADNTHWDINIGGGLKIFDSFGNTARNQWIPGVDLTQWHVYNVYSASGDWAALLDNVSSFTNATNTVGWSHNPRVGRSVGSNILFDGDIAAIVLFDRKLTSGERSDVYDYLYGRYFLSRSSYGAEERGIAAINNAFGSDERGVSRVGYATFGAIEQGRYIVFTGYGGEERGRAAIYRTFGSDESGRHKVIYQAYGSIEQGRAYFLNSFGSDERGGYKVAYLPYGSEERGVHQVWRQYGAIEDGRFLFFASYNTDDRGEYRVANDALARYELFYGVESIGGVGTNLALNLSGSPLQTFTSLPHSFDIDPADSGTTRKYRFVLRQRNAWGLSSQNLIETIIEIDSDGNLVVVRPSAPIDIIATPSAGGTITITARYFYSADGVNQADKFLVYAGTAAVDFSSDVPTEVGMIKSDGVAKLSFITGAFTEGQTVHVAVRTRRTGVSPSPNVDSTNSDTTTATATLLGPAGQSGELFFDGAEKQAQG